jgi:hypothetical protein
LSSWGPSQMRRARRHSESFSWFSGLDDRRRSSDEVDCPRTGGIAGSLGTSACKLDAA